jgi:DNA-binding transcriptional regulator YhcF (GntR family)
MLLEESSGKPIYKQIIDYLESMILNKEIESDKPLPSVRSISLYFKVNPHTVLKAYQDLMQREIIIKKRGLGMFLTSYSRNRLIEEKKGCYLDNQLPKYLNMGLSLDISPEKLLEKIKGILKNG